MFNLEARWNYSVWQELWCVSFCSFISGTSVLNKPAFQLSATEALLWDGFARLSKKQRIEYVCNIVQGLNGVKWKLEGGSKRSFGRQRTPWFRVNLTTRVTSEHILPPSKYRMWIWTEEDLPIFFLLEGAPNLPKKSLRPDWSHETKPSAILCRQNREALDRWISVHNTPESSSRLLELANARDTGGEGKAEAWCPGLLGHFSFPFKPVLCNFCVRIRGERSWVLLVPVFGQIDTMYKVEFRLL